MPDYGLLSGVLQNPALFSTQRVIGADGRAALPVRIGDFPSPAPAMTYLIMAASQGAAFITLLLAATQTVPTEVVESSRIDGANGWQIVRRIMIPAHAAHAGGGGSFSPTPSGMNGRHGLQPDGRRAGSTEVLSYMLLRWAGAFRVRTGGGAGAAHRRDQLGFDSGDVARRAEEKGR